MKLYWVGGPTFILELGGFRVLADPVFGDTVSLADGGTSTRQVSLPDVDMTAIDLTVVSRNRSDHVDKAAGERIGTSTKAIAPQTKAAWLQECGFTTIDTVSWWDERSFDKGEETLHITSLPTHPDLEQESHGFLFHHTKGDVVRNVYWTGDTQWFSGAREIKTKYDKLDLIVPVVGAVGEGSPSGPATLSGKEAMQFIFMAQPKRIVPVGYNTFSHYTEGVDDLQKRIDVTMYEKRLVVVAEGESFER